MLLLDDITFRYRKDFDAVVGVTAEIGPGLYLLLGENGAGKTTLLHLMCGLLFPCSGSVTLDGTDIDCRRPSSLSRIFFMSDDFECPFPTINSLAAHHGAFYPTFNHEMLYANLADFGLTGKEKLRSLSLGMRRKSYMAYALALGVDILLLDEPANGMDIDSKKVLRRIIARCVGEDQTLVVATHNIHDLGTMFDHLLLMKSGRLRVAMPMWKITGRVAFVSSSQPVDGAIYQEPDAGRFKAIVANEDGIETDIDLPLLYSAAMAPVGDLFIDFITKRDE